MNTFGSVNSGWIRAIQQALDDAGFNGAALVAEAGIDAEALGEPLARIPMRETAALWRLAVARTGDEAFGLRVAQFVGRTTFPALSYALEQSASLHEALDTLARYCRVVSDVLQPELQKWDGRYRFLVRSGDAQLRPEPEAIDAFMLAVLKLCRRLRGSALRPLTVELVRSPPLSQARHAEGFACMPAFGALEDAIVFRVEDIDVLLGGSLQELARHNEEMVAHHLARMGREDVVSRVRTHIEHHLSAGSLNEARTAAALSMSTRSLQRKLAGADTSYVAELETVRRELAQSYLVGKHNGISEIAFMLGFADTSTFTHAFRRWTGVAPSTWRARQPAAN